MFAPLLAEIGSMISLPLLDLSENRFTGKIFGEITT
jgi:hypothetical protein